MIGITIAISAEIEIEIDMQTRERAIAVDRRAATSPRTVVPATTLFEREGTAIRHHLGILLRGALDKAMARPLNPIKLP